MPFYAGFNTETDIPDLSGKVFLVTGGTGGIGKATVLELAKHKPAHVFFTGRNQEAADAVLAAALPSSSAVTFIPCDLASLASVEAAAAKVTSSRLDVFIANAGIMAVPPGLTADGYEVQFGTNHVGHATLLFRLLPLMKKTAALPDADVRFVSVTSQGSLAHPSGGIDFATLRTTQENMRLGTWGRYGQSKLANILLAKEVARRYPEILSVAVHPGVVRTELVTKLNFWYRALVFFTTPRLLTPEEGCLNTVWAATGKDVKQKVAKGDAAFFEPVARVNKGDSASWDEKLAKELWEWTEKETGVKP